MSTSNPERVAKSPSLQPTRYDRAASLLISMLILTGASFAVLVVVWLGTNREMLTTSGKFLFPPDGASGEMCEPEPVELESPQLSELPQLAIAEPIVELSTLLSRESIAAASTIDIDGPSTDPRTIGKPSPPEEVPRWERWEIRYEASSLQAYARQLDFFSIELGAAGGKPLVDYASRFTAARPVTRSGSGSDEERLYMTWRGGRLQTMDRALLENAGIDVTRRTLMQFYPEQVEATLASVELEHATDGRVDKLRKTIFGVRHSDDGYEFYVIEQR